MADLLSAQLTGYLSNPATRPGGNEYGGRTRRYRATITLASQATTDNIALAKIPAGSIFAYGLITASVSLSTAVVAIGTNKVHASNGQLRAAGTFTAVDTPTPFGLAAAVSQVALTADTWVYLTIATAALPSSGTLNVDLFYTNA